MRKRVFTLFAIAIAARAGFAQPSPRFEAATIKLADPSQGFGIGVRGMRFTTPNSSVSNLIGFAYGLHPRQIAGGADWVESEKYYVVAEADPADGPAPAMRTLVQNLLADRFGLRFHKEKKDLLVYAIEVAKSGAKFLGSPGDANGAAGYGFTALGTMTVTNGRMEDFAGWMQRYVLDRPVVDQTGISGRYNFRLNWRPDDTQFNLLAGQLPTPSGNAERPDLFSAVQQQLGLRLESKKALVDVLVIDHVERPSAN